CRGLRLARRARQGFRMARSRLRAARRRPELHQCRSAGGLDQARPALRGLAEEDERPAMNLLGELRRRNVIRMAGLYLVGAWLLVQVAATLLPVFEAPAWVMKTLVGLLALGLIPALVFSWVFELTPEGIKRDTDIRPEASIAHQTAR